MKYSTLEAFSKLLQNPLKEIILEKGTIEMAKKSLQRMLELGEGQ